MKSSFSNSAISRYSFVRQCKPRKDIEIVKRSEIKLKLEEKLIGLNRGIFGMKVVKKEEILALLEDLENCNEILKPTEQLEMVAGSKRTKLGLRQYVNLGEFIQSIDIQNSVAINVVNFTVMGLQVLNGALKIEAAFTPVSDRRVEISLQHASLEPETLQKLFENNFDLLLGIFNPAGWLDVTYVDDTHRIGRDDKDNIFYLERIP